VSENPPRNPIRSGDPRKLVVWRFVDSLRGHENQVDGLIEALSERTRLETHTVSTPREVLLRSAWRALRGKPFDGLPDPDLLIGAGTATHVPLLIARRTRGGRSVVLMKPGLPLAWFDLLIVPEMEDMPTASNVLLTRGALNRVRGNRAKDPHEGLILIGGPDRNHSWSSDRLCAQIETIVIRDPDIHWTAASSRRTPPDFLPRLGQRDSTNLATVAVDDVDADWLPGRLASSATVWVSEDSVSMIYEALTAGAATGLLRMPPRGTGEARRKPELVAGIESLLEEAMLVSFEAWQAGKPLKPPPERLDEAGRCAEWILERWMPGAG
jgi:mitochondrial fission protein ELM1